MKSILMSGLVEEHCTKNEVDFRIINSAVRNFRTYNDEEKIIRVSKNVKVRLEKTPNFVYVSMADKPDGWYE